jgi:peroxiredoxin
MKDDIMENHEQKKKKKKKKWKTKILWAKQTSFLTPCPSALQPLGSFSHMVAYRSSSKNTQKMNLEPILNKTSPRAHMESEFHMFGVVHLSKEKNEKKLYFFTQATQKV